MRMVDRNPLTENSWYGMKKRCLYKKHPEYRRYGGAGITICERWLIYDNFLADMGDRPSKAHTLDRIDGTKGYFPGNCRWATAKEQSNNRKDNILVNLPNFSGTLAQACEHFKLNYDIVGRRISRGMLPEEAVTKPIIPRK